MTTRHLPARRRERPRVAIHHERTNAGESRTRGHLTRIGSIGTIDRRTASARLLTRQHPPLRPLESPDYQGSTVWTSLGAIYLQVLRTVNPVLAARETARYVEWIERDGTFWEVTDTRGQNWVSPRWIMIGEESVLWSAVFGDLLAFPAGTPAFLAPLAAIATESLPIAA